MLDSRENEELIMEIKEMANESVPHASESRSRKIRQMNAWLESWCRDLDF